MASEPKVPAEKAAEPKVRVETVKLDQSGTRGLPRRPGRPSCLKTDARTLKPPLARRRASSRILSRTLTKKTDGGLRAWKRNSG